MSLLSNAMAIPQLGGYNLTDSLRFRSSASASLERTPTTTGNQKTFTASFWIKRGLIVDNVIMSSGETGDGDADLLQFHLSNQSLRLATATTQLCLTNAVLRDPSSWYHVVLAVDTTQATASNRIKIYLNNLLLSFSASSMPAQNTNFGWNKATNRMKIARAYNDTGHFDGYMTEINFVDGQALTASDFGETNEDTGVWKPIEYTGTYGTNGFYLNFSDATSTTTLGYDYSGNSNNWTTNNISLTAGTTYDLMSDVPTLTDEDTSNFATLNPLVPSGSVTIDQANLKATSGTNAQRSNVSTISVSSGKYYWETTWNTVGANDAAMTGIIGVDNLDPNSNFGGTNSYAYVQDGGKQGASSYTGSYGDRYVAGDVIGTALDLDAGTITFYRNGTTQGTAFTGLPSVAYYLGCSFYNSGDNFDINFGQRPFAYTPPTGYKKLNTYNLPDSSIVDGSTNFNTVLYTGNGSTNAITGVGFSPDLVWGKNRGAVASHNLLDTVRGATKRLFSNSTEAEVTTATSLTSFDSDGFTLGSDTGLNTNTNTYVAWNWRGSDSSAVSNTDGTITSSVSANTTAGFSVVTYTGTGSAATIGHGLGVAPEMVIVKCRSAVNDWAVYHASNTAAPETDYLLLNSTAATADDATYWNDTAPSSTVFSIGTNADVNTSSATYVAYCFAEVEGFSKFGSYTGNGSTDGPFVYTGFRPAFIIFKRTDTTSDWNTIDTARNTYNLSNLALRPNTSGAESTYTTANSPIDFISNGFKLRGTGGDSNASGGTYIYMAFAENPMKHSLAR